MGGISRSVEYYLQQVIIDRHQLQVDIDNTTKPPSDSAAPR
ncbi:hypothetical protein [Chamaesiphon sp. VAR_69_metabat_338]|nr:hypothetical protein [Chamaesiphon sp. VAR_69_metabat_338]